MGASFDAEYGRMSGNLSMEIPNPTTNNANLILYGFSDIPSEDVTNSTTLNIQVLNQEATDGTQIWNISHNGVDTHPIHFHIFDVQLISRLGWDGQIALPRPQELGWKDTVRISPLMDTIVAVRPRAPALPFGIPNSMRPLNPAIPIGSAMGFNSVDWVTGEVRTPLVTNILYDFGWEYVWHCHILSHEEMDMMRPIILRVTTGIPNAPTNLTADTGGVLNWTDPTPVDYVTGTNFGNIQNEIGFIIERADAAVGNWTQIGQSPANVPTFTDLTANPGTPYDYRVSAYNASGDSGPSALANVTVVVPTAPTLVSPSGNIATLTPTYTWNAASGATAYIFASYVNGVRAADVTYNSASAGCPAGTGTCSVTPVAPLTSGDAVTWLVRAINGAGTSGWSPFLKFNVQVFPATPTLVGPTVTATTLTPTYTWNAVPTAASYVVATYLNGVRADVTYTAAAAGCSAGTGTCSVTPAAPLANGDNVTWLVRATNAAGTSAWSAFLKFTVGIVPSTPTLVSPSGTVATLTPTYTWNAVPTATNYVVATYVNGVRADVNYTATTAGCAAGTGTCSVTPAGPLTSGDSITWLVRATNIAGTSGWSSYLRFLVQ
jgi:hypothetical protein